MVELAQQGKRVVRLKGGDPFIFGRGGEELQVAAAAGIPFGGAGRHGRCGGDRLRRHSADAPRPRAERDLYHRPLPPRRRWLDWADLARARQTLAIYMGTMKAADISQRLIAHGRAADTPVAVISRGTRADQQVQIGTLDQLEHLAQRAPLPALLVIGEVVELHHQIAWFGHQSQTEGAARPAVVNLA